MKINITNDFNNCKIHSISTNGESITVIDGVAYVDGVPVETPGPVTKLVINGNTGSIRTKGSLSVCGTVTGRIDAGGSVQAGDVTGNIDCGGSVQCGKVGGSIKAGGSVRHS